MKRIFAIAIFLFAACGNDGGATKTTSVRLLLPGALLSGPAGGGERVGFSDGSSIKFTVSGRMTLVLPKGVYTNAAFPAEVTFAVLSSSGSKLTGKAAFDRVSLDSSKVFTGQTTLASGGAATLTGSFKAATDTTFADIQSFSYTLPATGDTTHTVVLESERLEQARLTPQP